MWSDADADPPECAGAGRTARRARPLANGFPRGRALCPVCDAFVPLTGTSGDGRSADGQGVDASTAESAASDVGMLSPHPAFRGAANEREARLRAEWFNTHGWE